MRPATILLVTFLIWIAAKGRLKDYWALATTDNVGESDVGPGSGSSHAEKLPGFSWSDIFGSITNGDNIPQNTERDKAIWNSLP